MAQPKTDRDNPDKRASPFFAETAELFRAAKQPLREYKGKSPERSAKDDVIRDAIIDLQNRFSNLCERHHCFGFDRKRFADACGGDTA